MGIQVNPIQKRVLQILGEQEKNVQGTLNQKQLKEYLLTLHGSKFISVATATPPRMRKTNNPYLGALKVRTVGINVNADYEKGMNRLLEKKGEEPDFEAGENWHQPVFDSEGRFTPFAEHKKTKELYLRGIVRSWGDATFMMPDGTTVAESDITPFIQESKPRPLAFNVFKLENIYGITSEGTTVLVN